MLKHPTKKDELILMDFNDKNFDMAYESFHKYCMNNILTKMGINFKLVDPDYKDRDFLRIWLDQQLSS